MPLIFLGVPEIIIPDNLKSGVTKLCYYEPDINPTYLDMAKHYGTAIIPEGLANPTTKPKWNRQSDLPSDDNSRPEKPYLL